MQRFGSQIRGVSFLQSILPHTPLEQQSQILSVYISLNLQIQTIEDPSINYFIQQLIKYNWARIDPFAFFFSFSFFFWIIVFFSI